MTYDVATDAGKVRLLIRDTNEADEFFSDAEISAFLSMNGSEVRMAAAEALETIAADEVMVLKVIKIMNLSTNGAAVADSLMKRAASMREQAELDGGFDYAEIIYDDFSAREYTETQLLRNN